MNSGDEAAAIALLKRAVELDSANRLTEVGRLDEIRPSIAQYKSISIVHFVLSFSRVFMLTICKYNVPIVKKKYN